MTDNVQEPSAFAMMIEKLRYKSEEELKLLYIKFFQTELSEEWKTITGAAKTMQTVKGLYKGGKVELLEHVDIDKPCKVIVTFVEDDDVNALRKYSADEDAFSFWNDSGEDVYQDYLKSK